MNKSNHEVQNRLQSPGGGEKIVDRGDIDFERIEKSTIIYLSCCLAYCLVVNWILKDLHA